MINSEVSKGYFNSDKESSLSESDLKLDTN